MNFCQAQAEGVAIGALQIRRGFFQLFDKRISAEVKQLFSGPIPKLLCIFFDKLGSRATQSVSKPSSDRAAQRSGHCGAESGCSHTNRWLRPGIGAERGHCRFTRRLALTGISVLAPNSLALYTRRGIPAHNYFLWPDLRLGTGSRLCQCEPPTAGRDVLQISGLLAGDVKELRNDNPTRDLQMAADRIRPHPLCSPVVPSLFSFAARC